MSKTNQLNKSQLINKTIKNEINKAKQRNE